MSARHVRKTHKFASRSVKISWIQWRKPQFKILQEFSYGRGQSFRGHTENTTSTSRMQLVKTGFQNANRFESGILYSVIC